MEQRTTEWFAARLGKVTASRVADVLAKTKTGYGAGRKNYLTELALERLTGTRAEGYTNAAMQRGTEMEPVARRAYESATGNLVEETGMVAHPRIPMCGASPDGLVDADGLVEIKVPSSATHAENLLTRKPDARYIAQMQLQMACTGRQWCDFVSFDDRFPEPLRLCVVRIERDDEFIRVMEDEIQTFLMEVSEMVESLKKLAA